MADDLVGGAGAAEDVEGPVGAEDACGVALGVAGRADVVEPGAERRGGDAEVGAEEIFAEEAMELLRERVFAAKFLPKPVAVITDVDVSAQVPKHVLPNIGSPVNFGIWYPKGFSWMR